MEKIKQRPSAFIIADGEQAALLVYSFTTGRFEEIINGRSYVECENYLFFEKQNMIYPVYHKGSVFKPFSGIAKENFLAAAGEEFLFKKGSEVFLQKNDNTAVFCGKQIDGICGLAYEGTDGVVYFETVSTLKGAFSGFEVVEGRLVCSRMSSYEIKNKQLYLKDGQGDYHLIAF